MLKRIFEYLDTFSLVQCERVCKGWNDLLTGPDQHRIWKKFCDRYFWCPKGGWDHYINRSPRKNKFFTAKTFYKDQISKTCKGCHRPTTGFSSLFNELVCLGCRYSLDKYFYYSKTEVNALHLDVSIFTSFLRRNSI